MTDETQKLVEQLETPSVTPQANILLNKLKRIPPEVHRIPSCGLLYKNGELSSTVKNGELEMYTFTANDELDLKSPDLLLDGRAIERVIRRCVPGVEKPLDLFSRDLDYIMLALTKISYGDTYTIYNTHDCENAKEHKYDVSLTPILAACKKIDPTTLASKYSVVVGEGDSSYKVNLRPLKAKHAIDIIQHMDKETTEDERRRNLFAVFIFSISDVDGITDIGSIAEWLSAIPVMWIEEISKRIEEISNWGLTHTHKTKCKDCDTEIELNVNANPLTFFI